MLFIIFRRLPLIAFGAVFFSIGIFAIWFGVIPEIGHSVYQERNFVWVDATAIMVQVPHPETGFPVNIARFQFEIDGETRILQGGWEPGSTATIGEVRTFFVNPKTNYAEQPVETIGLYLGIGFLCIFVFVGLGIMIAALLGKMETGGGMNNRRQW
ncbi:MAG: hypothetical protein FWE16_05110 [Firmicutes bacterium]|nr:hypothetical protein [Bacillota bacterium]